MVKRSSSLSTFRSLILTWPILRLVSIGLVLVAIGGLWELFFSGAHILHLLSWLMAILVLAIPIAIIIYIAQLAGRSEDHVAHERLRMALISGKSVAWDLDLKTGRDDWFGDLQTMFGIPSETFRIQLGEFYNYVQLEDRARVAAAVADARENHKPYTCEFRVVRKDGTLRWVTATGKFFYANGGKPVRMLGIAVDITDCKQAEEALAQSKEKFSKSFRQSPVALALTSKRDNRILDVNETFELHSGWKRDEIVGRTSLDLNIWVDPKERDELARRTMAEGQPRDLEVDYRRKDGTRGSGLASVESIQIAGEPCVLTAIVDITERKRTEQVIHDSEQRLRHLIESSRDWIHEMDRNGAYTYVGPQCRELLGYEPEELIGKKPLDFIASDEARQFGEIFQSLFAEPRCFSGLESTRVRKDGRLVVWETSGVPVFDKNGEFCGYRGLARDITARHHAEQALRESEERFRLLANTAPVMIWTTGTDKACDYANKTWLDFMGRPLEAQLGDGWAESVHPNDVERCMNTYVEAFNKRDSFEMQYRLRRCDGEYRWIQDTGVPRFNADGTFAGYIGSGLDITEIKQAEEAMASMGRRLIEAHEQERTWIGRELHDDINQRLALLAVELEQCTHASSGIELAEKISHAQQRILEIARDVQSLSHRLHSSKLEYLGLVKASQSFCKELSNKCKVAVSFIHTDVPLTLPKEVSLCLFRVLQEALQNAVKHSGSDHLAVHLQGISDGIELRVMDTGLGFEEPEAIARQGLGLISMRERLHMVHGEFSVESKLGGGTKICARVPLPPTAAKAMAG